MRDCCARALAAVVHKGDFATFVGEGGLKGEEQAVGVIEEWRAKRVRLGVPVPGGEDEGVGRAGLGLELR